MPFEVREDDLTSGTTEPPPLVEDQAPDTTPAVLRFLPPNLHQISPLPKSARVILIVGFNNLALPVPCVLGRHGTIGAALFADDRTVSRAHAEITNEGTTIAIRNVASSGNTLSVDGTQLPYGASIRLSVGRHSLLFGERFTAAVEVKA